MAGKTGGRTSSLAHSLGTIFALLIAEYSSLFLIISKDVDDLSVSGYHFHIQHQMRQYLHDSFGVKGLENYPMPIPAPGCSALVKIATSVWVLICPL